MLLIISLKSGPRAPSNLWCFIAYKPYSKVVSGIWVHADKLRELLVGLSCVLCVLPLLH